MIYLVLTGVKGCLISDWGLKQISLFELLDGTVKCLDYKVFDMMIKFEWWGKLFLANHGLTLICHSWHSLSQSLI